MAKKIRPQDTINGYSVVRLMNNGPRALAYEARNADGVRVFLKQYKSPTPRVPWYRDYVDYEHEKRRRIEDTPTKQFCVGFLDIFEAEYGHRCLFQAFEFADRGGDLRVILGRLGSKAPPLTWGPRITIARVLTSAIGAIHNIGLVHGDLKPENVQLIEDSTITAGYRTKLIDMDSSILTDRTPPWHKHEGYAGTANYFSPEHLRGDIPQPASDVFTCGLILYELLTGAHPYSLDDDQYSAAVLAGKAPMPNLLGKIRPPEATETLRTALRRALSPNLRERPTARDLHDALNGRLGASAPTPPATPAEPRREPKRDAPHDESCLILIGPNGARLSCHVPTEVTRALARQFGDDAQYLSDPQFTLRRDSHAWILAPNPRAQNETLLNGKPVTAQATLSPGDTVAVGRAATGIVKLPLRVEIGG